MSYETILVVIEDGIARLTFNRRTSSTAST